MNDIKILYWVLLSIFLNPFVCHNHPLIVNPRAAQVYHIFRRPMSHYARQRPVIKVKNNPTCLEKCGDKYFVCSVDNCPEEDAVCNRYCTDVFRYCFKNCSLESPTPSPLQQLPVVRNYTNDDSISATFGYWIFDEKLYKEMMKRNSSSLDNLSGNGHISRPTGLSLHLENPNTKNNLPQMQFARIAR